MKPKYILIAVALVASVILLRLGVEAMRSSSAPLATQGTSTTTSSNDEALPEGHWAAKPEPEASVVAAPAEEEKDEEDERAEQIIQEYNFSPEKIASLRATVDGDPRSPPIERKTRRTLPTDEELADPALYAQYEERQEKRFFAGFVKAVEPKINKINAHMAEMEKHDFPDRDKFRKIADEKIQALTEMKAKLLEEHPELMEIETPLLDLSRFDTE